MVSVLNPTHFWTLAPDRCWTTRYAWCGALALTHELAGLAAALVAVPPHPPAVASMRASVALAPMRCLRTVIPPGGLTFPNAPLKADRQELPCRCARTVCRLGVQVSWLADRRHRPPSRGPCLSGL